MSLRFLCPLKQNGGLRGGNGGLRAGLCQENGIDHELVVCNIMAGENKTPEFLKMNPMHCIPTMVCFSFLDEKTWGEDLFNIMLGFFYQLARLRAARAVHDLLALYTH